MPEIEADPCDGPLATDKEVKAPFGNKVAEPAVLYAVDKDTLPTVGAAG